MKILLYGHSMLRQPCYEEVKDFFAARALRDVMVQMLTTHNINGLSAPQVGAPVQLVVFRRSDGSITDIVNPYIYRMYGPEPEDVEFCPSCPPIWNRCQVPRMQVIHVTGRTIDEPSVEQDWKFKGREARTIQHEVDHLAGTFFFDRARVNDRAEVLDKYRQWKTRWKSTQSIGDEVCQH
jgi:peptide deformylase